MRRFLKLLAGVGVVVVLIVAGAAGFAFFGSNMKMHRTVQVQVAPIALPTDQAALDRGAYLYKSRGCEVCHGADGAGAVVIDDGGFYVKAPHISAGDGSVTASYKPEDWVRTIRHGVKPNGEPTFIMPSEDFNRLTDADVGAIASYVRTLPAVAGTASEFRVPLLVRFLYAAGMIKDAAAKIDHSLPPAQPFASNDELAHGAYVAAACKGCHNEFFSGGAIPGAPPTWPAAANLTPGPGSALTRYSNAEALAAMFRSGKRPDGTAVSTVMPFGMLSQMSSEDVDALYGFLKTVPAAKQGEQPEAR
ncbi:MAG TPA: c-type cytochrome [Micropepsaceae bacterium]|nr:c-type cytochrome [Micropepsaceae bacterium]